MFQLMYISSVRAGVDAAIAPILLASRRNNDRDCITGLLYADGRRFLQVLEGPLEAVENAFARISADPRHCAIVVLSRRAIDAREFGDWAMAHRTPGEDGDAVLTQIADRLSGASPSVRGTFEGFAKLRRAA